jgi:hypothetical protein
MARFAIGADYKFALEFPGMTLSQQLERPGGNKFEIIKMGVDTESFHARKTN